MWAEGWGPSSERAGQDPPPCRGGSPPPDLAFWLPELAGSVAEWGRRPLQVRKLRQASAKLRSPRGWRVCGHRQTVARDPSPSRPQSTGGACFLKGGCKPWGR